jgi:hypothetical protein
MARFTSSAPSGIPQRAKYWTDGNEHYPDLSWNGKHIYFTYDGWWDAIFLPTDDALNLPIGFTFTIVTDEMMGSFLYLQADDTDVTRLTLVGFGQSNNGYDIGQNTMATVMKIDSNRWIVSGYGITED